MSARWMRVGRLPPPAAEARAFDMARSLRKVLSLVVVLVTLAEREAAPQTTGLENQLCLSAATGFDAGCTANDVVITEMQVVGPPLSCTQGAVVPVTVEIKVLSDSVRYDVGLWVNQGGESAITGTSCYRDALLPVAPAKTCDHSSTSGTPSFWDADQDMCGDVYGSDTDPCGSRVLEGGNLVTKKVVQLSVLCADSNGDLVVDTGACASWTNSEDSTCQGVLDALPGTGSACECGTVAIGNLFVEPCEEWVCSQLDGPCSTHTCVEGACVAQPVNVGSLCDDGLFCTSSTTCSAAGVCDGGTPTDCSSESDECHVGECNETTNACEATPSGGCDTPTPTPVSSPVATATPDVTPTAPLPTETPVPTATAPASTPTQAPTPIPTPSPTETPPEPTATPSDPPQITVDKTASSISVVASGEEVTFTIVVANVSTTVDVMLVDLSDDQFGDLDGLGTCATPAVLAAGASYTCSFTRFMSGVAGASHTNVVTAIAQDAAGNVDSATDSETIVFTASHLAIRVQKDANPASVTEPGGNVTFTITVTNLSSTRGTIVSLFDDQFGNLDGLGNCDVPANLANTGPASSRIYSCSFTASISGAAGAPHTNTVTAVAVDDAGDSEFERDSATVEITTAVTPTPVSSPVATATPEHTPTPIPTETPPEPTATPTSTPTRAPTAIPTPVSSPTLPPEDPPTPTLTATPEPTATATADPTATATPEPTSTPPATPTATISPTPTATPVWSGMICRSAGFWGSHARQNPKKPGSRNLTQAVIDLGGGCIEICGEVITTSLPIDSADSAVEALCLNNKAKAREQLARHLTATALNCIASGANGDCQSIPGVEELFRACNQGCVDGDGFVDLDGDTTTPEIDCAAALDCLNRGGTYDSGSGSCQLGTCTGVDAVDQPCGDGLPACPTGEGCVDLQGNCHAAELGSCSNAPSTLCTPETVVEYCGVAASCEEGPAGSPRECASASKTACALVGAGESKCTAAGNECPNDESESPEQCCDAAGCPANCETFP